MREDILLREIRDGYPDQLVKDLESAGQFTMKDVPTKLKPTKKTLPALSHRTIPQG